MQSSQRLCKVTIQYRMEHMCTGYAVLHSRIEASETRINKELRDKDEESAREAVTMDTT